MKKIVLLGLALTLVFAGCSLKNGGKVTVISPEEAMAKGQSFINENLLPEGSGVTVLEATEDNGLYKLKVKLPDSQGEQEVDSYMNGISLHHIKVKMLNLCSLSIIFILSMYLW